MADHQNSNNTHNHIPNDILIEVLSWLPGKSLMRFNSVSNYWLSVITNPVFVDMHHARSYVRVRGASLVGLIISLVYENRKRDGSLVLYLKEEDDRARAIVHKLSSSFIEEFYKQSNIMNGLRCFYNPATEINGKIFLCNFTTREILPLPDALIAMKIGSRMQCFLCFDRTNKEYKVVSSWRNADKNSDIRVSFAVFTVGSKVNQWRPIEVSNIGSGFETSVINGYYSGRGLCADGKLYWESVVADLNPELELPIEVYIIMFDVRHEKFEIINYPGDTVFGGKGNPYLVHIRGHLSLVHIGLEDPCSPGKFQITSQKLIIDGKNSKKPLWIKEVTTCQFPQSTTPRLTWFFCNLFGITFAKDYLPFSEEYIVDSYDLETGEYKEQRINRIQALRCHFPCVSHILAVVVENITPLKLMGTHKLAT